LYTAPTEQENHCALESVQCRDFIEIGSQTKAFELLQHDEYAPSGTV